MIIELQRRMMEAGRIRAGEKGDKGEPRKRTTWRLTSKDRTRLEHAATLWGGEVREWAERAGEFELGTETAVLPIMLLPGQAPTTWYESWSKGGCQRRCDGVHELISDQACLCGDEDRECKPYTRLSVLLPDLPGLGSWLLTSTGWNAASELAGAADLLQRASAQGILIPARLRLEPRSEIKAGQTRRYAVPVIDLDISFRQLLGTTLPPAGSEASQLPPGYTPLAQLPAGPTLVDGLAVVDNPQPLARTGTSAAPIPATGLDEFGGAVAVDMPPGEPTAPAPTPGVPQAGNSDASSSADGTEPASPGDTSGKPLTKPQATKLNVLVGRLRDDQHRITTEQLWAALAKERGVEAETMIELLGGLHGADLHWSPLRDSLTRGEAHKLIDRLEQMEKQP